MARSEHTKLFKLNSGELKLVIYADNFQDLFAKLVNSTGTALIVSLTADSIGKQENNLKVIENEN